MKKLSLILGLIAFCLNVAFTQNVTYSYIPQFRDSNYIIRCYDIDKVYYNITKHMLYSFRLLNNNRFEKINYSRKKNSISTTGGYYKMNDDGFLYTNSNEVPKKKNYKECFKYYVKENALYNVSSTGNISASPYLWKSENPSYFKENYFNPLTGKYLYGRARTAVVKNKTNCCVDYLTKNNDLENKFIVLAEKVIPEYSEILKNNYAAPESFTKAIDDVEVKWIPDNSDSFAQNFLLTVLHETVHQKNFEQSSDTSFAYYLPKKPIVIVSKKNNYYESSELIETIDTNEYFNLHDFMASFIGNYLFADRMSSNVQGIYGILDEFTAYANQANAVLQIIPLWQDTSLSLLTKDCNFEAYYIPAHFYCFNLMIGWYIEHATKYQTDMVDIFKNDLQLRKAYTEINTFFEGQMTVYNEQVKTGFFPEHYDYTTRQSFESTLSVYNRLKPMLDEFKTQ